ncbi:hypothetical protein KTH71_15720 [Acinetobacter sp. WU_MDCI_Axc73]|nr:hypothetical protein [Acinetobacter sp. WU_MDCI_Axc73]
MSEFSNSSLMKSMGDLFSKLSNSSYYNAKFLEKENDRFYQQLDLLFDERPQSSSTSRSIVSSLEKNSNYLHLQNVDLEASISKKAQRIKETIRYDDYIPGEISKTQLLFEKLYSENVMIFRESYLRSWLDLYRVNDIENIIKFISISSDLEYELLQERADTLIIAGYSHTNPLVMEASIRAIEKWQQPQHVYYLQNMRPSEVEWIEEYKCEVIEDLAIII